MGWGVRFLFVVMWSCRYWEGREEGGWDFVLRTPAMFFPFYFQHDFCVGVCPFVLCGEVEEFPFDGVEKVAVHVPYFFGGVLTLFTENFEELVIIRSGDGVLVREYGEPLVM